MDEDAKTARGVAEAAGGFGCREAFDDVGAEGLVEAVRSSGGLKEVAAEFG